MPPKKHLEKEVAPKTARPAPPAEPEGGTTQASTAEAGGGTTQASTAEAGATVDETTHAATVVTFPPTASSRGKKYYCFVSGNFRNKPAVACGEPVALGILGGRWFGHALGRSPRGFSDLEAAIKHIIDATGKDKCEVIWA